MEAGSTIAGTIRGLADFDPLIGRDDDLAGLLLELDRTRQFRTGAGVALL